MSLISDHDQPSEPAVSPTANARAKKALWILAPILVLTLWYANSIMNPSTPAPVTVAAQPAIDKSPAMQAEREAFIDKLVTAGYATQVVRNGTTMPRVWVTPKFAATKFTDKANVLSVVYAYYFDGRNPNDSVAVIDAQTGKEIGRYGSAGLDLK